jgi:tRNA wybutosine-synthesizing protein 2
MIIPPENGETEVIHREGGTDYILDPTRIMFSSGNTDERRRSLRYIDDIPLRPGLSEDVKRGVGKSEDIMDMFAGIGYFALPISRHPKCRSMTACEINPVSFDFLKRNIRINNLTDKVKPILGDNRTCLPERSADRIVMGYIGGTFGYLDRALDYLREGGGIVHLHDTVKIEEGSERLFERCQYPASNHGFKAKLLGSRKIKSFAPRIDHVVIDVLFEPI